MQLNPTESQVQGAWVYEVEHGTGLGCVSVPDARNRSQEPVSGKGRSESSLVWMSSCIGCVRAVTTQPHAV